MYRTGSNLIHPALNQKEKRNVSLFIIIKVPFFKNVVIISSFIWTFMWTFVWNHKKSIRRHETFFIINDAAMRTQTVSEVQGDCCRNSISHF